MLNCEFSDESSILSKSKRHVEMKFMVKSYIFNKMLKIYKFFIEFRKKISHIIQKFLPVKSKREEKIVPPFTYKGVEHELSDLNYFKSLQDYDLFWFKYWVFKLSWAVFFFNFSRNFILKFKIFFYYFSIGFSFFFFFFDDYFHILPAYIIKIF